MDTAILRMVHLCGLGLPKEIYGMNLVWVVYPLGKDS